MDFNGLPLTIFGTKPNTFDVKVIKLFTPRSIPSIFFGLFVIKSFSFLSYITCISILRLLFVFLILTSISLLPLFTYGISKSKPLNFIKPCFSLLLLIVCNS